MEKIVLILVMERQNIRVLLLMESLKELESIQMRQELLMKVPLVEINEQVLVSKFIQMEVFIQGIILETKETD